MRLSTVLLCAALASLATVGHVEAAAPGGSGNQRESSSSRGGDRGKQPQQQPPQLQMGAESIASFYKAPRHALNSFGQALDSASHTSSRGPAPTHKTRNTYTPSPQGQQGQQLDSVSVNSRLSGRSGSQPPIRPYQPQDQAGGSGSRTPSRSGKAPMPQAGLNQAFDNLSVRTGSSGGSRRGDRPAPAFGMERALSQVSDRNPTSHQGRGGAAGGSHSSRLSRSQSQPGGGGGSRGGKAPMRDEDGLTVTQRSGGARGGHPPFGHQDAMDAAQGFDKDSHRSAGGRSRQGGAGNPYGGGDGTSHRGFGSQISSRQRDLPPLHPQGHTGSRSGRSAVLAYPPPGYNQGGQQGQQGEFGPQHHPGGGGSGSRRSNASGQSAGRRSMRSRLSQQDLGRASQTASQAFTRSLHSQQGRRQFEQYGNHDTQRQLQSEIADQTRGMNENQYLDYLKKRVHDAYLDHAANANQPSKLYLLLDLCQLLASALDFVEPDAFQQLGLDVEEIDEFMYRIANGQSGEQNINDLSVGIQTLTNSLKQFQVIPQNA